MTDAQVAAQVCVASRCARHSNRCLVLANSFAEYAPEPNPETKKKDVGLVRARIGRRSHFAGIWTEFKGDRGSKSKPRVTPPPLELRAKVFRQVGSE